MDVIALILVCLFPIFSSSLVVGPPDPALSHFSRVSLISDIGTAAKPRFSERHPHPNTTYVSLLHLLFSHCTRTSISRISSNAFCVPAVYANSLLASYVPHLFSIPFPNVFLSFPVEDSTSETQIRAHTLTTARAHPSSSPASPSDSHIRRICRRSRKTLKGSKRTCVTSVSRRVMGRPRH